MSTITIAIIVLVLTVLAFVTKQPMLHAVCIVGWLVLTFLLGNMVWPAANTFMLTAVIFFGVIMVIVETVATLTLYLSGRPHEMSYDEEKEVNKRTIYKLTKRREKRWYE